MTRFTKFWPLLTFLFMFLGNDILRDKWRCSRALFGIIEIFFNMLKKIAEKIKKIKTRASTTWATHKNSEKKSIFHVPRYMEFCFFFKSMYPGTWYFVFSSNPCTRVHGILIFLQIHVPGYMKYWFLSLFLCVAQVAEARVFIFLFFWQFFSTC